MAYQVVGELWPGHPLLQQAADSESQVFIDTLPLGRGGEGGAGEACRLSLAQRQQQQIARNAASPRIGHRRHMIDADRLVAWQRCDRGDGLMPPVRQVE